MRARFADPSSACAVVRDHSNVPILSSRLDLSHESAFIVFETCRALFFLLLSVSLCRFFLFIAVADYHAYTRPKRACRPRFIGMRFIRMSPCRYIYKTDRQVDSKRRIFHSPSILDRFTALPVVRQSSQVAHEKASCAY